MDFYPTVLLNFDKMLKRTLRASGPPKETQLVALQE